MAGEGKLAVIRTGGKQYIVREGDTLRIEKIDASEGTPLTFGDVLLVAEGEHAKVGAPIVPNTTVAASILQQGRAKKVTIMKFKPKVRYKKKQGHRQMFTEVKIVEIKS